MKKTLLAATITLVAVGFAGCAQHDTRPAATVDQATYQSALADAKVEQKKAAAVTGEWRDTGKIINQAEEAAAAGDYAQAKALADQAAMQSRLGQQQAAAQVNAGNPSYLY